ncbi:MAG: sulfite exporter TauE/SafE family protein [Gammaproteobacteria bacterium]
MPITDPLAILVIASAFIASVISSTFAIGGGFIMIAVLSSILPMQAVVPVHSPMMLGLSLGRSWVFRRDIQWDIVIPFILGCLIGVFGGSFVYFDLPAFVIALVVGLFILLAIWLPPIRWRTDIPRPFFWIGIVHSFCSTLFSFGGLFQPIMIRQVMSRFKVIATLAAGLLCMNMLKITAYTWQGFDYRPWLAVITLSILAAIPGTLFGKKLLQYISEQRFRLCFRIVMTGFGLRLLYRAWVLYPV